MILGLWRRPYGVTSTASAGPHIHASSVAVKWRYFASATSLCRNGWKPVKTFSMVNWCGHGQEYQPWLQSDGFWLVVSIVDDECRVISP